jgi:hypothetical protein
VPTTLDYTRAAGRRHTYRITVDERGRFTIALGDRVLKRGLDAGVARGFSEPGRGPAESSLKRATVTVDYLIGMREE